VQPLEYSLAGRRRGGVRNHRSSLAAAAREAGVERAACGIDPAVDHGEIVLRRARRSQRSLQCRVSRARFRDDQHTRRESIEPSDERGTRARWPVSRVPEERVHQRAVRMSICRMHDHAGWFVDREQVLVFENHGERQFLGGHHGASRAGWKRDGHEIAMRRAARWSGRRSFVHGDETAFDPFLNARARGGRDVVKMPLQHEVEALAHVAAIGGNRSHIVHNPIVTAS